MQVIDHYLPLEETQIILLTAKYWTLEIEQHGGQIPDFKGEVGDLA